MIITDAMLDAGCEALPDHVTDADFGGTSMDDALKAVFLAMAEKSPEIADAERLIAEANVLLGECAAMIEAQKNKITQLQFELKERHQMIVTDCRRQKEAT